MIEIDIHTKIAIITNETPMTNSSLPLFRLFKSEVYSSRRNINPESLWNWTAKTYSRLATVKDMILCGYIQTSNEMLGEFTRRRQSSVIYALSSEGLYVLPLFICSMYYLEPWHPPCRIIIHRLSLCLSRKSRHPRRVYWSFLHRYNFSSLWITPFNVL